MLIYVVSIFHYFNTYIFVLIYLAKFDWQKLRKDIHEKRDYGIRTSRKFTFQYYIFVRVAKNWTRTERYSLRFDDPFNNYGTASARTNQA